jgi:type III pantothenate kinase
VLGLFRHGLEGEGLAAHFRLETRKARTGDEYAAALHGFCLLEGIPWKSIDAAILATVVPPVMFALGEMCKRHLHVEPLIVGPGVKTGMPIHTNNPREVGADLIVDAVAAYEQYGGPCVVVDFGTATTFGAVTGRGEYLGHAIAPGIVVSMEALASRAAKLPLVELVDPGSVIGKTTVHSMQAGAVYGFAGQVDGIVRRMRRELGGEAVSVATGGLSSLIFGHTETLDHLDGFLTLRGLEIIYRRNQ